MKSETNIPGLKMLSQGLICWLGVAGWSIYFWHKVSSLVLCTLSSTSWKPQSLPRAHFTSWHSKVIQTLEHPWTNWLSSQSMSKCQTHLRIALNSAHENLSERRKSEQYGGKTEYRHPVISHHKSGGILGEEDSSSACKGQAEEDWRLTKLILL